MRRALSTAVANHKSKARILMGIFVLCALAGSVLAQESGIKSGTGLKGIIYDENADGLVVEVLDQNNRPITDYQTRPFKAGDRIRISVTSSFDGYLYAVNLDPQGNRKLLAPAKSENNKLTARVPNIYPQKGFLTFDSNPGRDAIQIYATTAQVPAYEALREDPVRALVDANRSDLVAVAPSTTSATSSGVLVSSATGLKGIIYEQDSKGAITVIPDPPQKLPTDGAVGITLHFNHI